MSDAFPPQKPGQYVLGVISDTCNVFYAHLPITSHSRAYFGEIPGFANPGSMWVRSHPVIEERALNRRASFDKVQLVVHTLKAVGTDHLHARPPFP